MTTGSALVERLAPVPEHGSGTAREWFVRHGLPEPRDEAWRSMPLDDIIATLGAATPSVARSTDGAVVDQIAGRHVGTRIVFVNGRFAAALSDPLTGSVGLRCGPSVGPGATAPVHLADRRDPLDGFEALNRAAGNDVTTIHTTPGSDHGTVHLTHLTIAGPGVEISHPRALIDVAPGSRLRLLETFGVIEPRGGPAGTSVTNAHTGLVVGEGSEVDHVRVQTESAGAVHLGRTEVHQAGSSRLRSTSVMIGARIARHTLEVHLDGPGARADLDGIYLPTGSQRHDVAVGVHHTASSCSSTQRYSGIVDERGHGSFGGRIVVRPDTVGTDAHQLNRNLVLCTTAQADTRPWLEILADDVRCTHGATIGRLDEDALFYLRSRGIPRDAARALLIEAFAAEVIEGIRPATLRAQVYGELGRREQRP